MAWAIWQRDQAAALMELYELDPDNQELYDSAIKRSEESFELLHEFNAEFKPNTEGPEDFLARTEAQRMKEILIDAGSYYPGPEGLGDLFSPETEMRLLQETQEFAQREGILWGVDPTNGMDVFPDAVSDPDGTPVPIKAEPFPLPNDPPDAVSDPDGTPGPTRAEDFAVNDPFAGPTAGWSGFFRGWGQTRQQ